MNSDKQTSKQSTSLFLVEGILLVDYATKE